MMRKLINFCFEGEGKIVIVTKFGAASTGDKNKFQTSFDKASSKLAINFLLDNCFVLFFNFGSFPFIKSLTFPWILIQCLSWLNLFLYYHENKWLLDARKRDLR